MGFPGVSEAAAAIEARCAAETGDAWADAADADGLLAAVREAFDRNLQAPPDWATPSGVG